MTAISPERIAEDKAAAERILDYWDAPSGRVPRSPHSQDEIAVARAYLTLLAEREEMRRRLTELTEAAESDLKMNQSDEEGSGWWSLRTENAITRARAALSSDGGKGEAGQ